MCDAPAVDRPRLVIAEWGRPAWDHARIPHRQLIEVDTRSREYAMAHSVATGEALVSNGQLGVDVIRLGAGDGFVPHTHPGDHLLICVAGTGTITFDGRIYETGAGRVYLIDGEVPHAVGAITDHVILAVGSPHRPIDSDDRMKPVEYVNVLAPIGSLECLICQKAAAYPAMLHEMACPHCPCPRCVATSR